MEKKLKMDATTMMDIDPLNNFELTLENYPIQPSYPYPTNHPYPYQNPYQTVTNFVNNQNDNGINDNINEDNNKNEDVKPIIDVKKKKVKGKKSNYWNKKIMDKDFAFYGCSVCNISYTDIKDLDQHVQIHTNRMTSYDLRLQNIKKRKRIKKEKKKIKKEAKIKQELELDIKPEDGYIGNELTIEYNGNNCNNSESTHNSSENTHNNNGNIHTISDNTHTNEKNHNNDGNIHNNSESTHNNSENTHNNNENIHNNSENTHKNENTHNNNENIHNNSENTQNSNENTHKIENINNDLENIHNNGKNTQNNNGNTHNNNENIHKIANTNNESENTHDNNGNNDNNSGNNDNNSGNNDNIDMNIGEKENKSICMNPKNFINVYKCFGCDKQFALSYYLRIHVRSHTDEKPYPCKFCGQSFITASKLGRHNKRVHLTTRNQCRICYKYFNKFELLVAHFDKKHADDKLEGEPYDYNAILPYLKEIEDQMQLKESKPKVETLWPYDNRTDIQADQTDSQTVNPSDMVDVKMDEVDVLKEEVEVEVKTDVKNETECEVTLPQKYEIEVDVKNLEANIVVEDIKIDFEVKREVDEVSDNFEEPEVEVEVNLDDSVKDERHSDSDSDYFPSEGWAASPRAASPPPVQRAECDICHKTFSSNSYLVVHMRTHTGEKPYTCYICDRGFITAGKMHRHVLTHEESWKGEDGIKPDGYDIKDDPDDEKGTAKKRVKQAKDKLLKKNKNVEKKYKRRPHACEYCQKRFLHIETLQVHKKSHEGEPLVFKCNFCLEVQPDSDTLAEHEATHVGPKPYLCTVCGKQYTKKETMVYHKKNHKLSEPSYVCDICSKRFRSQTKLQRHIASHSTERFVLRYECPVCAHMFHTRYHVQMHLNTHQKEGLIQEDNRNAILAMVLQNARKIPKSSENSSTTLSENIPTDERSRICNICGQIFQHFYYLEEHLKTHGSKIAIENVEKEEIKKYTCQICSKSFKLHYYLKLHSFTHTKEKPYICQQCGKGFITKGKLKRHLETHQGLKKFQCHICYKFFTRPSYLRIHVRTIHGTQDYNFREYTLGQGSSDQ